MSLVILDRDGVINVDSDEYIKSAEEWIAIPNSLAAIARLSKFGFTIAIATNQSGLGRGLFDLDDLEAMHNKLIEGVAEEGGEVAGIFYCPHHPDEECQCRKPRTGLVDVIEAELDMSAQGSPLVGDSLKDLQLAIAKKCIPLLVRTGKGVDTEKNLPIDIKAQVKVFNDLNEAADYISQNFRA